MAGEGQDPGGGPSFTPSSAMTPGVRGRDSGKLGTVTKTWSLLGKAKAAKVMHPPSPPCSRGETAAGWQPCPDQGFQGFILIPGTDPSGGGTDITNQTESQIVETSFRGTQ